MRIALLTDGISPYVIGGMQRHSYYLAKYLAKQQVHVDLFHFNQSNLDIEKLNCFSDEEKKYIHSIIIPFPQKGNFPGHYIYESYLYSKAVYEYIKPKLSEYNFIYTKGLVGWKLINEKNKGLSCPPIGINVHGYEMFQPAPSLKTIPSLLLLKYFIKPLLYKSDKVFSYGGKVTTLLTDTIHIPPSKIIEVPGGIEPRWLVQQPKQTGDKINFVFMGRAERRKGIEELNTVLKKIKDHSFQFTFIGPIPRPLQIQASNIHYLGELNDVKQIQNELQKHDVLVCPSHSEGMPNVILEAMASGLAVIATEVGAVSKMLDATNGWLIKPANESELQKALISAIESDRKTLQSMKQCSVDKVKQQFLWDELIIQLLQKIS